MTKQSKSSSSFKRHSFFWVALAIFIFSITTHFFFSWLAFITNEQNYWFNTIRDVFENVQSEVLQLILQVVLLAYFYFYGSAQSKEGQDRIEAKVDWLMDELHPAEAANFKRYIEGQYPKK